MAKPSTPAAEAAAITTATAPTGLNLVREILSDVSDADQDPTERMAQFILTQPATEWERLWAGLPNVKDNVGESFTVTAIRARESDFEGGIGVYLIADVTWDRTGEIGLLSVSSQMGMVQLLTLFRRGQFPAHLQIVAKAKPTKAGYRPIHFKYLDSAQASLGDPGVVVSEQ